MIPNIMMLALELSLCWMLVRPSALLLQSPGLTAGRLAVQSNRPGANIFINKMPTNQNTNFTFVVSPGTYWVAVTGGPDNLNCGGSDGEAKVAPGRTATLICTSSGFKRQ